MIAYDKDSGGAGGRIRDIYLRHAHYLQRYETGEANTLLKILDDCNTTIRDYLLKVKGVETKAKYSRIATYLRELKGQLVEQLNGQFELDGMGLIEEEINFVNRVLTKDVKVVLDLELPAPKKVWAAASFAPLSDTNFTFGSMIENFGDRVFRTWDAATRSGYLLGIPSKQIVRNVLGSIKDMDPGQIKGLRNSLEMNTRTAVAVMASEARNAVYRENDDIFDGVRWLSTLDLRSCPVCASRDLVIYKRLEDVPTIPAHRACRCVLLPYIKGFEGIEGDRAAMEGPVSDKMTYDQWLRQQPDEFVKEALGASRFKMFKEGMSINSFVSGNHILTLKELAEK
jgi:hypothetical protein